MHCSIALSIVLVTGASSGFGLAIASEFAARGHVVFAGARRPPELKGVVSLMLDVTREDSRRRAVEAAGPIDVLVNNAGTTYLSAWEDAPEDEVRRVFDTNFFGPLALIQQVLPGMRERGSGRIVNVTSVGELISIPFNGPYTASKHALGAATVSLRGEVAEFGVHVSSVLPGPFRTSLFDASHDASARDSLAYASRAAEYRRGFAGRLDEGGTELSPVIEAVIAAATDPQPRKRYIVARPEFAMPVESAVAALEAVEHGRGIPAKERS